MGLAVDRPSLTPFRGDRDHPPPSGPRRPGAPYSENMCGRFTLRVDLARIAHWLDVADVPDWPWRPRYNIAPTQPVVACRLGADGRRQLVTLRWGLVPPWATDAAIGARCINARAETVHEKPAFRNAFARRRCLVPADGFFEWRTEGKVKQPYWFGMTDDGLFAIAGIWERWAKSGAEPIESVALLTTDANDIVRPVHKRMPVILPRHAHAAWLDPTADRTSLLALLRPFPAGAMKCYAVSRIVNRPAEDRPECIEPLRRPGKPS